MGLPTAFLSRGRPLKGPFYLRLSFLATRKRVHELLKAQLIGNLVLLQLIFNVLLDFLFVLSYRIHEVSLAQKCRFPYLYFKFACLSKIMRLLFPLRYPIT